MSDEATVEAKQDRILEAVEAMGRRGLLSTGYPYSSEVRDRVQAKVAEIVTSLIEDDPNPIADHLAARIRQEERERAALKLEERAKKLRAQERHPDTGLLEGERLRAGAFELELAASAIRGQETEPATPACACRWEQKFNGGNGGRFRVDETTCPAHDATPPTQPEGERRCATCGQAPCNRFPRHDAPTPEKETPAPRTESRVPCEACSEAYLGRERERDEAEARVEQYEEEIREHLPRWGYDDGENDEATELERIAYTAEHLREVTAERDAALKARDEATAKLHDADNWRCIGPDAPAGDCSGEAVEDMCIACAAQSLSKRYGDAEAESSALREERDRLAVEVQDWRGGLAAGFGVETADPRHTLLRLAKDTEDHHQEHHRREEALEAQVATLTAERDRARIDAVSFGRDAMSNAKAADEARAHVSALKGALRMDKPWPILSVLRTLADMADHSLQVHNCDADGWENVSTAAKRAREIATALEAALSSLPSEPAPHYDSSGKPRHPGEPCRPGVCWTDEPTKNMGTPAYGGASEAGNSPGAIAALAGGQESSPQPSEPEGRCATCEGEGCPECDGQHDLAIAPDGSVGFASDAAPPPPAKAEGAFEDFAARNFERVCSDPEVFEAYVEESMAIARDRALEDAAKRCRDYAQDIRDVTTRLGGSLNDRAIATRIDAAEDLARNIAALKSAPPSAPPQNAHEGCRPDSRIIELAQRLTMPGAKAAFVSASEVAEVADWILSRAATSPTSTKPEKEGE